jgi:hypothetical protein
MNIDAKQQLEQSMVEQPVLQATYGRRTNTDLSGPPARITLATKASDRAN